MNLGRLTFAVLLQNPGSLGRLIVERTQEPLIYLFGRCWTCHYCDHVPEGKTDRGIRRCLKPHLARRILKLLQGLDSLWKHPHSLAGPNRQLRRPMFGQIAWRSTTSTIQLDSNFCRRSFPSVP